MRLHLHGVVRATHPAPTPRVVTWEDLAVAVSELPEDQPLTEQDAVRHLDLLCALLRNGPVLPLRFGTTAPDEEAVRREVLTPTAPQLRGHLDRLDGMVEVQIYLRFEEDAALRAIHDESGHRDVVTARADRTDLNGRIRLGELIAQRLVAWRRGQATTLLAPVSAVARDAVALEDREHTEERWAFLLPQHEVQAVRTVVDALAAAKDVTVSYLGPLPAYSFLTAPTKTTGDGTGPRPASRWGW